MMAGKKIHLEGYVTANEIVNQLGIKNSSTRRKVYKYIKNIMYKLHPSEYEELLFKDKSFKRYVMKIPKEDVPIVLKELESYRKVQKTVIEFKNGKMVTKTMTFEQW